MATLFAWECGSHLHGPQELEVYLHTTRPEHEAVRMAQVDQRLRVGTALSSGQSNVDVDALSCKVHCNYLLVVRLTGEESRT
jgi:hypothetical protein